MFVGFCIMFISTISKCLAFALGAWVTGRVLMATSPGLRTQIPVGGGEVGQNCRKKFLGGKGSSWAETVWLLWKQALGLRASGMPV